MSKAELAAYLVSLHALMTAQEGVGRVKSAWLAAEYETTWNLFQKEVQDEARARESQ